MKRWPSIVLLLCLFAGAALALPSPPALAQSAQPDQPLADPVLEARARQLMKDVRCVVCQAQSIAESDAGIASDMRKLIRVEIAAGKSDEEIRRFLADRYGDFVLFKPPFKISTALLWAGPFLLLAMGAVTMVLFFRRRARAPAPATLSAEEMRRVTAALQGEPEPATRPTHGSGA
ncbi:MAG: cytochrome c-type biogenesis protein CcmH [Rhodospirillaceae bacterium]|nr:cytochrome c-type biogenesis protein CcmH [Rhodospirillaceae bacterium]